MSDLKPASKGMQETYDPQGSAMSFDSVFSSVAPGVASSGTLAHKWGASGDHSASSAPPSNLKGD